MGSGEKLTTDFDDEVVVIRSPDSLRGLRKVPIHFTERALQRPDIRAFIANAFIANIEQPDLVYPKSLMIKYYLYGPY